jgi:hypothetical protein
VISSASATPDVLWPRNHKMIDVTIHYDVTDDFDAAPACQLTVERDETTAASTAPAADWEIIDAHHVRLRAGRPGPPRAVTYTVGIACTDTGGLESQQGAFVYVPLRP